MRLGLANLLIRDRENLVDLQVLYLTTVGRLSGLSRKIEIWFVASEGRLYILAEHFHRAHWVQNIGCNPQVHLRIGTRELKGTARVLDQTRDRETWQLAQKLARNKYGWGEGLPVEIILDEPL